MSASTNLPAFETGKPPARVFRRQTSIIGAFVFAAIIVGIGIALIPGEADHGFLSAIAPLAVTVPLALIVLTVLAAPRVVLGDDRIDVHNSFVSYQVPYPAVDEIRQTRMGLMVRTIGGKAIPATAYATGAAGRVLKHGEQADELIRAAQDKMEFRRAADDEDLPPVVRRFNVRSFAAVLGAIVVGVLIVIGAVHTFH